MTKESQQIDDEEYSKARLEYARNKARIEAGLTYRGHKARTWSPSKSPSSYSHR